MSPRRKHDAYPTVADLCRAIVGRLSDYFVTPERVIEPTAGDGAFVRAARAMWPGERIAAIDLIDDYREACLEAGADRFVCADAREIDYAQIESGLALGNPPFTHAAAILRRIRTTAPDAAVAFLLPVSFWGRTAERDDEFWRLVKPTYFAPIHPRPSFTGDGRTDRMEYGLFGFGEAWSAVLDGPRIGNPIVFERGAP